jgi:phenylacetate-CoA ligase
MEITGPHNIRLSQQWYQRLGLWQRTAVSVFDHPRGYVSHWRRNKPDYLYGYSGSLRLMAEYILERKINDIRPTHVFGVSDSTDPDSRRLIKDAFGTRLLDLYGAAEAGCIAWECPQCPGYHINSDTVLVEIIRNGKPAAPGEKGRIVVTNLLSYAMPVIRYDLGDIGSMSAAQPVCRKPFPLMKDIAGRNDAYLLLPGGRVLPPLFFFGIMKPVRHMQKWKVVQTSLNHIAVYVVPGIEFSRHEEDLIAARCRRQIPELKVSIQTVQNIPRDRSGKIRSVISHVNGNRF